MKDKKTSMSKINSRHPQLSDWSMDKSSTPYHHCDSRLEMQEITNESSTNLQNHNTDQHPVQIQTKTTYVKIKKIYIRTRLCALFRKSLLKTVVKHCSSPILCGMILGVLTDGLILATVIVLWLTSNNNTITATTSVASMSKEYIKNRRKNLHK